MHIARSVLPKLAKLLGVILIVSFLTFCLTKILPGDPVTFLLGPESTNEELRVGARGGPQPRQAVPRSSTGSTSAGS